MASPALRPLSAGEVLDTSFGLYRRMFTTLVVIQLVCMAVPFLLSIYVAGVNQQVSWLGFTAMLLSFVLAALASAATAMAISETYMDRPITAGAALRRAVPRLGPLLLVSILIGLLLVASAVPFVFLVGGASAIMAQGMNGGMGLMTVMLLVGLASLALPMLVASGVAVSTPVVVLEDGITATAALSRTWYLTKGYRLRITGLLFVCLLIIMIPYFGLIAISAALSGGSISHLTIGLTVAGTVARTVITPILYCLITLLYYDLRVRKEGFDLEMLAASLQPA
jgi:hypothetical protein